MAACVKDAQHEFRYVYVNPQWARRLGHDAAECVGKTDYEIAPAMAPALVRNDRSAMAAGGESDAIAEEKHDGSGERIWYSVSFPLDSGRLAWCAVDITRQALFRLIHSHIIGVVFGEDDVIVEANAGFLEMLGYSREDVENRRIRWTEMSAPEFKDEDRQTLEELVREGESRPKDKEYIRKDGSRVPVEAAAVLLDNGAARAMDRLHHRPERAPADGRTAAARAIVGRARVHGRGVGARFQ